jgi:type IV pilus assembly protein PilW
MRSRATWPPLRAPHRHRGAGIIETMVGILIGLIVVLVIYQVFASAEGYKRLTTAQADAQVTGLYAQFVLARELGNAGNGISIGFDDFAPCSLPLANSWQLKPIPVLITDGGSAAQSDSFVVFYGSPPHVDNPVVFLGPAMTTPNPFIVQSPNGFKKGDWVIAGDSTTGNCWLTQVTAPPAVDGVYGVQGGVDITYSPVPAAPLAFSQSAKMINLGQDSSNTAVSAQTVIDRVQYSVAFDSTGTVCAPASAQTKTCQLYSQVINPALGVAAQPLVPVAPNIVLMKAQYGIDPTDTNIVTFWTSAVPAAQNPANTNGIDYSVGNIGSAGTTAATIRTIKSVRIGIVVRSDEANLKDTALQNQPAQYLFNCSLNTDAGCQGRIKVDNVGNGGVLADGYRYRLYETTVPLRNAIWNK